MATSRCCCAADRFADITGEAVGGDYTEPHARDDPDFGLFGAPVQVVQGTEHLQLVADVDVVHAGLQAGVGERGGGVQERASHVEHQVDIGQCDVQCGGVVQGQDPVWQVELVGQSGNGWCAPTD